MLKITPRKLSAEAATYLEKKTRELTELSYTDQVTTANKAWNNKSATRFHDVRTELEAVYGLQICHYCEWSEPDEVEHIWPKTFYPERTFSWQNYLYSCGPCNGSHKRDKFAVLVNGERVDLVRKKDDPVLPPPEGQPLFIDPRQEDPMEHIELDLDTGELIARDDEMSVSAQRAEYTVETVLNLNRDALIRKRKASYRALRNDLRDYVAAKSAGETQQQRLLWQALQSPLMPTVWQEMIRSREYYPQLQEYYEQAPELLEA